MKFDATGRTNFYAALYGHVMPLPRHAVAASIDDVGQYFQRTDDKGPWGANPGWVEERKPIAGKTITSS